MVFKFINDFPVEDVKLLISDIRLAGPAKIGVFNFDYSNNANVNTSDLNNNANSNDNNTDAGASVAQYIGQWAVSADEGNHMSANPLEAIDIVFPIKNSKTPNLRTSPYIEISNIADNSGSQDFNEGGEGYEEKSDDGDVTVGDQEGNDITDFSNPILSANGYAISQQIYIIPEAIDYEKYYISFNVTMIQGNIQIGEFSHNVPVNEMAFEQGKAYCLTASFNANNVNPDNEVKPIEFNVEVLPWGEDIEGTIGGFPEK